MSPKGKCAICSGPTFEVFDLAEQPFANALVESINTQSKTYPLQLRVCENCSAGQLSYFADMDELYLNYYYATPDSKMLEKHYQRILTFLQKERHVTQKSEILEIGSNVGKLLQFLRPYVNSVCGVDPARNIAHIANEAGIQTFCDFFNKASARGILKQQGKKDIILARHCFAHNPEPWRMIEGVNEILSKDGVFLVENAYFYDTLKNQEFDQIYHEHMYYYNLRSIKKMFEQYGLQLFDVLESDIHGGTMMFLAKRQSSNDSISEKVRQFLKIEEHMHEQSFYKDFVRLVKRNRKQLSELLDDILKQGKTVHAYGASAKSTVLLNYYNITNDMVPQALDSTQIKHGRFIPGVNIKVVPEEQAVTDPADFYLLTGWNYAKEIISKVRSKGNLTSKFILPHPSVKVIEG